MQALLGRGLLDVLGFYGKYRIRIVSYGAGARRCSVCGGGQVCACMCNCAYYPRRPFPFRCTPPGSVAI